MEQSDALPSDWINCHAAIRPLRERLRNSIGSADPTPWLASKSPAYWGPLSPDEITGAKLGLRAVAAFQQAMLNGALRPSMFDGRTFKQLPLAAFSNHSAIQNGLFHGTFELDPLWPDDWQEWRGCVWAIPKSQFEDWLASSDVISLDGLPPEVPLAVTDEVRRITSRQPTQRMNVSLSEAITWIAFGMALDADRAMRAITWQSLCDGDLRAAVQMIEEAAERLFDAGADAKVAFTARHVSTRGEQGGLTDAIKVNALNDYRRFDISEDQLSYGRGLAFRPTAPNNWHLTPSARNDSFTHVSVNRAELLTSFPPLSDRISALMTPLPAFLAGVGTVIALEEAVCRTAYGTASYDFSVWQSSDGTLCFTDRFGWDISTDSVGSGPAHIAKLRSAHVAIHAAMRDGALATYVAPDNANAITIPRLYWNHVDPQFLDVVYRGLSNVDPAAGSVVILSRDAFEVWLADRSPATSGVYQGGRAPAFKGGHPPSDEAILEMADEMKARGLDGREIAKTMRLESGFENVATTAVRGLIKGRWKPNGRPRKDA